MDDRALVAAMVAYMEQHLIEPITAEALAVRAGYSLNRFRQKFFNVTGETPSAYLRKRRLTEAAKAILAGDRIADVALTYGYSSQDNFTTAFRSYFGVTPTEIGRIEGKYRRFIRRLREAYSIMEIANLKQPPLCTTLMGCVKGASDYFDNDLSTSMLFGLTGHAFLLNIHTELCPSSPYVWNKDRFFDLLAKIGIRRTAEVERHIDTPPEQVARIEATLREALDAGQLCMLDFLEHQLVSGYDENGLIMLQPWNGNASSEVPAISFGTWNECLEKEGWAHLTVLRREEQQAPVREVARAALCYAVEMWREPERFEFPSGVPGAGQYRIGPRGYQTWISAVERGLGEGHGHWWNTQVWSECRENAAAFLEQLAELTDDGTGQTRMRMLASEYRRVSQSIREAGEKGASAKKRAELLTAAREREDAAVAGLSKIAAPV